MYRDTKDNLKTNKMSFTSNYDELGPEPSSVFQVVPRSLRIQG